MNKLSFHSIFVFLFVVLVASGPAFANDSGATDDWMPAPVGVPGRQGEMQTAVDSAIRAGRARDEAARLYRKQWFDREAKGGNDLTLLPTGDEVFKHRYEMIEKAKRSIYISTFAFKTDAVATDFARRLCERAHEVEVRVLADHRSSSKLTALRSYFAACGMSVMLYGSRTQWGVKNTFAGLHEKLMIVDGESVIIGGSGIANHYRHSGRESLSRQDADMRIDGPAACQLHREFVRNWQDVVRISAPRRFIGKWLKENRDRIGPDEFADCHEVPHGSAKVLPIYSNPTLRGTHPLLDHYLSALRATDTEVRLYAPYFIPRDDFMREMIEARQRGVKIKVLTNSPLSTDEHDALMGFAGTVGPLMKAGVEIYLWPHKSTMHRKGGIYNHQWAYVGSDNLDRRGQTQQTESVAFTDDAKFVAEMENEMDLDFAGAERFTPQMARKWFDESPWLRRKIFGLIIDFM